MMGLICFVIVISIVTITISIAVIIITMLSASARDGEEDFVVDIGTSPPTPPHILTFSPNVAHWHLPLLLCAQETVAFLNFDSIFKLCFHDAPAQGGRARAAIAVTWTPYRN